ncbi:MAG: hypothetical protein ACE5FT_00040 [Candidatus Nanoarchaeia archaeon]
MSKTLLQEKNRKDIKEIVIARLETLNKDSKIMLLGTEPMSVKQLLEEVRKDTELGKQIVEVQFSFLRELARGGL